MCKVVARKMKHQVTVEEHELTVGATLHGCGTKGDKKNHVQY